MIDARMIMKEELEELRKAIIRNHEKAGQKASGRTEASLRVEVKEEEGILYGRSPFGTLETGRKGGKVPSGFTGIIRQWMKDKGISGEPIPYKTQRAHKYMPQERGDMSFAYLVARKIRKSGTRLFRDGGRSDIYSNEIPVTVENICNRILELMSMEVKSIKLNGKEVTE